MHKQYINPEYPAHPDIYDACMEKARTATNLNERTCWIHLSDAVETYKSISPMEAYDALSMPYFPSYLTVRKSRYEKQIR